MSELCEGWDIFLNVMKCCTNLTKQLFVFVYVDFNECSEYKCHNCTNTIGSYNCSCNNGYTLVNGSICTGTIIRVHPLELSLKHIMFDFLEESELVLEFNIDYLQKLIIKYNLR